MEENIDEFYMKKAVNLAKLGEGHVAPNPLVGAIIVKDNRVIGQGYHMAYGQNHAEINAFKSLRGDCTGASMYVTLEPCFHTGKTPPCVLEIIKRKISRVIIGIKDPNPKVAGKSIELLMSKGIEVKVGIIEEQIKELNEEFIKYIKTNLPFVLLKSAMTLDGKIATHTGDSKWISSSESRKYVHKLRNRLTAIMVGVNTILVDNPMLNTRLDSTCVNPIKIVVDSRGKIPIDSNVVKNNPNELILATTNKIKPSKKQALKSLGVSVLVVSEKNNKVDLTRLMTKLGEMNIDSILLEGGATLNEAMLKEELVDKVLFFIGPKIIGGSKSKTPVEGQGIDFIRDAIELENLKIDTIDKDMLIKAYVRRREICLQD